MIHIYLDHNSKEKFKYIKNKIFIKDEIKKYNYIFSNVNGYSLDKEQRTAIVTDEINTLIVAGAGSGKSLTMIGKIRYLMEKGIREEEILCITFTKEAALNLENNIRKNYNYNIKVYTFHSLAFSMLKNYNVVDNDYLDYLIDEYFNGVIYNNVDMIKKVKRVLGKIDIPYKYLLKTKEYINLKRLIITFINLFKTNNHIMSDFLNIKKNKDIISIIIDIYLLYEQELKSTNAVDYNDMIIKATTSIPNNLKYKYIIVDEYQDTSYIRYKFLKSIIDKTGSKLICVGDDYQSIYRFNGCDIDMFINFKKYFGYTKVLKINNTYRNSQELISVAGLFIMKNKNQLYKKLRSNKHIDRPIVICYLDIYKLLDILVTKYKNILILGRNNRDLPKEFVYKDCNIRCMTMHGSKGLEEECVVILNVVDDELGIPCKIKDSKIINYISRNKINYPYDEERRLFYVGLTRTKNEVYLITKKGQESVFIKELKKDYCKYIGQIDLHFKENM